MKQFTNAEQTAKLIELGLLKPKSEVKAEQAGGCTWYNPAYSIGELIEMLEDVASLTMSYSYQKRGYYCRAIIPKRKGGGMYLVRNVELIDVIYEMLVKLKEEGVI